jgi:hypothetical protein
LTRVAAMPQWKGRPLRPWQDDDFARLNPVRQLSLARWYEIGIALRGD